MSGVRNVSFSENFAYVLNESSLDISVKMNIYCLVLRVFSFFLIWVITTAWKKSKYGDFSGPYFPVFGLNTEIYLVNLRIQPVYRKQGPEENSIFAHFLRSERGKWNCKFRAISQYKTSKNALQATLENLKILLTSTLELDNF